MKNFDFLVIGSNGLLGSNIVKILKKKKISFLTIAKKNSNFNIDLKNFKKLKFRDYYNNHNKYMNLVSHEKLEEIFETRQL